MKRDFRSAAESPESAFRPSGSLLSFSIAASISMLARKHLHAQTGRDNSALSVASKENEKG
jgi:hypothetical protein